MYVCVCVSVSLLHWVEVMCVCLFSCVKCIACWSCDIVHSQTWSFTDVGSSRLLGCAGTSLELNSKRLRLHWASDLWLDLRRDDRLSSSAPAIAQQVQKNLKYYFCNIQLAYVVTKRKRWLWWRWWLKKSGKYCIHIFNLFLTFLHWCALKLIFNLFICYHYSPSSTFNM